MKNPVALLLDWLTDQVFFPLWQALFAPEDDDAPEKPGDPPRG